MQVYRFELPEGPTAQATTLTLRYPDRPHDAEALLVDPRNGELAIVTKDFSGVAEVFTARRSGTLRKVAELNLGLGQAVTAGDVSADGRTIILRSYGRAFVWERAESESLATALKRAAVHRRSEPDRRRPGRDARAEPRRPRVLHDPRGR